MEQEQKKKELRRKAMQLPLSPGVYIMHNKAGDIIYIGKAKALKNRVSQYFGSEKNHDNKVRRMVSNVDWFEYILCDSEFEALVLESSLIKQHKPKYNILLKDDKGYSYVRVSQGPWPRITQVKQVEEDGAQYIGPYMSSWSTKQTVDSALKIFKLPDCSRKFPQDFGKGRPCLNYYIKQCCAPCRGKVTEAEYNEAFQEAVDFIKGGSSSSVRVLTEKMEQAAENLEFELAARLRDRINAIQAMKERQKVVASAWRSRTCSPWPRGRPTPPLRCSALPATSSPTGRAFSPRAASRTPRPVRNSCGSTTPSGTGCRPWWCWTARWRTRSCSPGG